jgi:hypothetical protein
MVKPIRLLAVICGLSLLLTATAQSPETVDTKVIDRIIAAEKTSQVMDIAGVLTNTYGARLTNSASVKAAGEYARKKLVEWQLANVRLETFNFGNGWTNDKFSMKLVNEPTVDLPGVFQAVDRRYQWSRYRRSRGRGSLAGRPDQHERQAARKVRIGASCTGSASRRPGNNPTIHGCPTRPTGVSRAGTAGNEPAGCRACSRTACASSSCTCRTTPARGARERGEGTEPPAAEAGFFAWIETALSAAPAQPTNARAAAPAANTGMPSRSAVTRFYFDEGVAGMIEPAPVRNGAILAITDTGETVPWKKDPTLTKTPTQIVLGLEDYIKLEGRVKESSPVSLQVDIKNTYQNMDQTAFNVVGEIKGTDKATELVVVGAHLDTVHLGKGATDNAAGVAVVMEAVRLLKVLALPMRRTVQIGLWTGEEQGVLGSMAFVDKYFFQRPIRQLRAGPRQAVGLLQRRQRDGSRSVVSTCRATRRSNQSLKRGWRRSKAWA